MAVNIALANAYGRELFSGVVGYVRAQPIEPFQVEFTADLKALSTRPTVSINGIIGQIGDAAKLETVRTLGLPTVCVSGFMDDLPIPTVRPDSRAAGRLAAEHLIERGFRHLAYLGVVEVALSLQRGEGFAEAARKAGVQLTTRYEDRVAMWRQLNLGTRTGIAEWVKALERPVAVYCVHDEAARMLLDICHDVGLAVPEDVAIMGNDNDELTCETTRPPLSSVELGAERVGYAAAKLMHQMLEGESPPGLLIEIEPVTVITRQSTDVLGVADDDVAAAVRFIREKVAGAISVEDVLKHVPINRRLLERKFKQALGRSPHAEILRARVERAQRLLITSELNIREIARRSGFRYVSHMTTVFRKVAGLTPAAYRQRFGRPTD